MNFFSPMAFDIRTSTRLVGAPHSVLKRSRILATRSHTSEPITFKYLST